jgi:nucleoside-diphosphate-sugar epimerase
MKNILVIGACGQIGSELVKELKKNYNTIVAAGHMTKPTKEIQSSCPFEFIDILKKNTVEKIVIDYNIDTIYHMATIHSVIGRQNPQFALNVNIIGLCNILEIGREYHLEHVIFPSSIAAFGPESPKNNTPNDTIMRPITLYGITKLTGELLGNYYFNHFGLDVRGIRLPGVISANRVLRGGIIEYCIEMYREAVKNKKYICYVHENTILPIIYISDAIKALIELTKVDISNLEHHCDFNINAMNFSAGELAASIKKYIPSFICEYKPDYRQKIADSWPKSLDDSAARREWGWKPDYDLDMMTKQMLKKMSEKVKR